MGDLLTKRILFNPAAATAPWVDKGRSTRAA